MHIGNLILAAPAYVGACADEAFIERRAAGAGGGFAGLTARAGASVVVTDVHVRGDWTLGITAEDAELHLERVRVGPLRPAGGANGVQLTGAQASLQSVEVVEVVGGGVLVDGGSARLTDVTVRGMSAPSIDNRGSGVSAVGGGRLTLARVAVDDVEGAAVIAAGGHIEESTDVTVTDVRAVNRGPGDDLGGMGVLVHSGGSAALERLSVSRVDNAGVQVMTFGDAPGSSLVLADARLSEIALSPGTAAGGGVMLGQAGDVVLDRVAVEDSQGMGVYCVNWEDGRAQDLAIRDLSVVGSHTDGRAEVAAGGLVVENGCAVTGERVLLADNEEVGLWVAWADNGAAGRPTVSLDDLRISGTGASVVDGTWGFGLLAASGAQVTVRRSVLQGNRLTGVGAKGWGGTPETQVTLEDVDIVDTHPPGCARGEGGVWTCRSDAQLGTGVQTAGPARITMERFVVRRSAFTGLFVDEQAVVRASHGSLTDNAIGLAVMAPDYDWDLLTSDVTLFDNTVDIPTSQPQPPATLLPEDLLGAVSLPAP